MEDQPNKDGAAGKAIDKVADTAHEAIDVAADAAKKMAEVKEKPEWMIEHEAADAEHFRKINDALALLPTKEDIGKLATEKSVRDVVHWQKNIVTTAGIVTTGGKWFYRVVLVIAPFVAALLVITGGWKTLVGFLFSPRL